MLNIFRTCFVAIVFSLFAQILHAEAVQGVRCVQQQLNAAGYDAGPADGLLGRKTKQALKNFAQANDFNTSLPLIQNSSTAYCRRLGLTNETLQAFWPSKDGQLVFRFATDFDEEIRHFIEAKFQPYLDKVVADFPAELPSQIIVFVAHDEKSLLSMAKQDSVKAAVSFATRTRNDCSFRNQKVGAAVVANYMYLCIKPTLKEEDSRWISHLHWRFSHEAVHIVQQQVAGSARAHANDREILRRRGPQWLVEGVASVYSSVEALGWSTAEIRENERSRYGESKVPDLRNLETQRAVLKRATDVYAVGQIASTLLIEKHGYPATVEFWKQISLGEGWEAAFTAAYGVSPEEFYTEFDQRFRQ